MRNLIAPAVSVMSRLRFAQKFILIAALFAIPLSVVMYFFESEVTTGYNFASVERKGVAYDKPLMQFFTDVLQDEQVVNSYYVDHTASSSDIAASESRVESDMSAVDTVDVTLGGQLKSTSEWKQIKQKWEDLKNTSAHSTASAALDAHAAFVSDVITFITHVGNNSNLILDPDIDSYYVMDTVITQIPAAQSYLAQARDVAAGIAARGKITPDERTQLTVLLGEIGTPVSSVSTDLEQAFAYNPAPKDRIDAQRQQFVSSANQFTDVLKNEVLAGKLNKNTAASVLQTGNRAVTACSDYYNNALPVLDDLLNARMQRFATRKTGVNTTTIVSLVLAVYFFLGLMANLSRMAAKMHAISERTADAAAEMAEGSQDLSERTSAQASGLEETAASMEQMTASVQQNAENANVAKQLADDARGTAVAGGETATRAVESMAKIAEASNRISDIISVIDEIAFQTNLLALNAAVEAARVGEQGRGFAVVASEVRNLAARSATAAKEIKALVRDSVAKVDEGSTLVNDSGKQLHNIVNSVIKVSDVVAEIAAASHEQSAGIVQVNSAIAQMEQITQQNAALVEEAAATAQSMAQQSKNLRTTVEEFKIDKKLLEAYREDISDEEIKYEYAADVESYDVVERATGTHGIPASRRTTRPQGRTYRPGTRPSTNAVSKGAKPPLRLHVHGDEFEEF